MSLATSSYQSRYLKTLYTFLFSMVKGGRMVWGHMEGGVVNGKSRTGRLLDAAWRVGCASLVCYSLQLVSYFVQAFHNAAALLGARVFNAVGVV